MNDPARTVPARRKISRGEMAIAALVLVIVAGASLLRLGSPQNHRVVTADADSGSGSLRQIIQDAPNGSTLTFAPELSGKTILLTSGQLFLDKNLKIDASALTSGVTISANYASRLFDVPNGATVSLVGLTLTKGIQSGDGGGGIHSERGTTLLVSRCTLVNNPGGGIVHVGRMLSVEQSTFFGNRASYGGAVACFGTTSINQCTISGNTGECGGGLFYKETILTVSDSIVAGNISLDPTLENGRDILGQLGELNLAGANIIPFVFEDRPSAPRTGPSPITHAPLLNRWPEILGNYSL